jgi:hypothetical protein
MDRHIVDTGVKDHARTFYLRALMTLVKANSPEIDEQLRRIEQLDADAARPLPVIGEPIYDMGEPDIP